MQRLNFNLTILGLVTICSGGLYAQNGSAGTSAGSQDKAALVRGLNNRVLSIEADAQAAGAGTLAALMDEANATIHQRAAALADLIAANPREAIQFAFSPEVVADLATKFPQAVSDLETQGTWQGQVERWVLDSADLKSSVDVVKLNVGQRAFELHFAGPEPKTLQSGDLIQVTGVQVGSKIAISEANTVPKPLSVRASLREQTTSNSQRLSPLSTASTAGGGACTTTGAQNTAVLLVTWPGAPALPSGVTAASLNDTFFASTGRSLNTNWQEGSFGQASATGRVYGPLTLANPYSCSTLTGAQTEALAQVAATGVDVTQYKRLFLVYPSIGCVAGFSTVGCSTATAPSGSFAASNSYIDANYASGDQGVGFATHEGGHGLGLQHAHTINAYPDVVGPMGTPGTTNELGDYFSPMGGTNVALYNAPENAEVLGWMTSPTNYQVVTSSGSYTLQPLEMNPPGLQALRVQRGTGNNAWLWIEYRQPIGDFDTQLYSQVFSGAFVHYEDASTEAGTNMLNYAPSANLAMIYPSLAAGQTWTDPYSNLSLSVVSATPSGLALNVNYGAVPCTHLNPTAAISPSNPTLYAGSSTAYTVTVTNNDSGGCSASTYNLSSSLPSGWPPSFSASTLTVNPGQSGSATMTLTAPSGTPAGTYGVNASAGNAANSIYTSSATANATVMSVPAATVTLSVPSTSYTRKSSVSLTATVLSQGTPVSGASVTFSMTMPNGGTATQSAVTGRKGTATWSYKLGASSPTGTYSAVSQATISPSGGASPQPATSNTVTFSVQ